MRGLVRFVAKRILTTVLVLLAVSSLVFVLLSIVPGDPSQLILGYDWTPEAAQQVRKRLGLDDPLHIRYLRFLWNALHGDLGSSYITGRNVVQELLRVIPASAELAAVALLISLVLGIFVGVASAVKQYSLFDSVSRVAIAFGSSVPTFWLGLILMYIFSVRLHLLPTTGFGRIENLILPAVTLSAYSTVGIARMTRSCMLEVIRQDYVRTARAKGLGERAVIFKHALKNAVIPVITLLGLYLGVMIGSAIVTEQVFAWPGLGSLTIRAVLSRDIPMIQGCVLTITAMYLVISLIVDISYAYLDPRIRV